MAKTPEGLIIGDDGKPRCWWHGNDPEYLRYHDEEWGYPIDDDRHLFEKICLEGFQSGLSWLTILRKRDNFRHAFDNFDYQKVAQYDEPKIQKLLSNAGIIRHRGKIEATINNAQQAYFIIEEFGSLSAYFWQYEPAKKARPDQFNYKTLSQLAMTDESKAMSKDLKKRGWKFVGPTTCYAFMQSMGIVNDHLEECICRDKAEEKRKRFERPKAV
jgi:DNA-3-methyladenine glycosylase I